MLGSETVKQRRDLETDIEAITLVTGVCTNAHLISVTPNLVKRNFFLCKITVKLQWRKLRDRSGL